MLLQKKFRDYSNKKNNEIVKDIAIEDASTIDITDKNVERSNSTENTTIEYEKNERREQMESLMRYVGEAIDKWSKQYNMDKLPKELVFKKVLMLMNSWDEIGGFKW